MKRGLYVIFYKSGEIYAGKYYDYSKIGKSYFGSSGIAKERNLKPAHVVKWPLPKGTTADESDKKETQLINYIANRYGLHNLVYYRSTPDFYSRFPHNGRCINCHDRDSKGLRALKPIQLNLQSYRIYGMPYELVTPEMRRRRRIQKCRDWYAENKDYVKEYQKKNADKIREYNQRPEVKVAHCASTMKCYKKNKARYNAYRNKAMTGQRIKAQETFGFFEYLDINKRKRKVSVEEIEQKKLNYEPQRPEWKHYFTSNEYIKPSP